MASTSASQSALLENLQKLYKTGNFVDLTIKTGKTTFKGSKIIFASQSKFFEKALHGSFKEARTNTVDLSEWEDDVIRAMVQHVYTGFYTLPGNTLTTTNHCTIHAKIYALAVHTELDSLQKSALAQFEACLQLDTVNGFASAAVVYGETLAQDRTLRDVLVARISHILPQVLGASNNLSGN